MGVADSSHLPSIGRPEEQRRRHTMGSNAEIEQRAGVSGERANGVPSTPTSFYRRSQRVGRKALDAFGNTRRAERGLRSPARRHDGNLFPTLPAWTRDEHGRSSKRQDILTAGTRPIDLNTSVYESHELPPVLAVTLSTPAYKTDITPASGEGKRFVNRHMLTMPYRGDGRRSITGAQDGSRSRLAVARKRASASTSRLPRLTPTVWTAK